MVKRADLIKSDKRPDQRKAKESANEKNGKYEKIPVYPSKIQTTAFPEKAYIFAIEKLVLISIVLFAFSVVLGIAIYYKTFLFKPNPLFIYYSDDDNQFKVKNFYDGFNAKPIYHNIQILAQDFLQKWIEDYYSINPIKSVNDEKWCDCLVPDTNGQAKKFTDGECSVCRFSDQSVYSVFAEFVQPVMRARQEKDIVRLVKILDIDQFFYGTINHNQVKTSILEGMTLGAIGSFMGSLYSSDERLAPFRSYLFYMKVDFMVVDFVDGKIANKEFFTSYNTVGLQLFQDMFGHLGVNKNWPNNFKVLEHSTNFILNKKYDNIDISDLQKQYKFLMKNYSGINIAKSDFVSDAVVEIAPVTDVKNDFIPQVLEVKDVKKQNNNAGKDDSKKNELKQKTTVTKTNQKKKTNSKKVPANISSAKKIPVKKAPIKKTDNKIKNEKQNTTIKVIQ